MDLGVAYLGFNLINHQFMIDRQVSWMMIIAIFLWLILTMIFIFLSLAIYLSKKQLFELNHIKVRRK